MSLSFVPGQRWNSEAEPELGLGVVTDVDRRMVEVFFPASEETRRYVASSAPLHRVRFRVGDEIQSKEGTHFEITEVVEKDGLLFYLGEETGCLETSLVDTLSVDSPEDRLKLGQWDTPLEYRLRQELRDFQEGWLRSPARGLVGGRVALLPHQLYIAHETLQRQRLRVLLADEPGLGKTIESCLILHHELVVGRGNRVLILVPESLQHQWFAELLRRFQLAFRILNETVCRELEESEPESNPFEQDAWVLCSQSWLLEHPKRMTQVIAAQWDLLVVDEAHHIEAESPAYELLSMLAEQIEGLLLLTATPEQLGAESHFARLQLLDPERYADFGEYQSQHEDYQQLAEVAGMLLDKDEFSLSPKMREYWKKADPALLDLLESEEGAPPLEREETVRELLDRFGPGRVIFRNARAAIAGFPRRTVHLQPLDPANYTAQKAALFEEAGKLLPDARFHWLVEWLHENAEQKVLLLCQTQELVERLEAWLRLQGDDNFAVFHEGLSLMQRDRNAAWFAEPEGAQILLCSEIGGEGRNFQFAQHLILFDVPKDPELLEQRIGRLDRIGQADEIHLYLPYVAGTAQEVLVHWYHDGLDAIRQSRPGGFLAQQEFGERLQRICEEGWREDEFQSLLSDTRSFQQQLQKQLEQGRNRLMEWSSFDETAVDELMEALEDAEDDASLLDLSYRLFDMFGVDVEKLSMDLWQLKPTSRLHPSFPWLKGDKRLATFDREHALVQENTLFLTADHPMFRESVELLLTSQQGTCSVVKTEGMSPEMRLVSTFLLEAIAPPSLRIERFLPPTPLRLALNHQQESVTLEDWSQVHWDNVPPAILEQQPAVINELVPALLKRSHQDVERMADKAVQQALLEAGHHYDRELHRLRTLQSINPSVSIEEVEQLTQEAEQVLAHLKQARVRLDSLQLQFVGLL